MYIYRHSKLVIAADMVKMRVRVDHDKRGQFMFIQGLPDLLLLVSRVYNDSLAVIGFCQYITIHLERYRRRRSQLSYQRVLASPWGMKKILGYLF